MSNYLKQIDELRQTIVKDILSTMKQFNLSEVAFDDEDDPDPVYVIWYDNDGRPGEGRVMKVTSHEDYITLEIRENESHINYDLDGRYDMGARHVEWLAKILDNIIIAVTENDEQ